MKKILLVLMILLVGATAFSQQTPRFTNYLFNGIYLNPALSGSGGYTNFMATYRNQWTDIPGSPQTVAVNADGMIVEDMIGMGIQFYNDKLGAVSQNTITLTGAYIMNLDYDRQLSFGLGLGAYQSELDGTVLRQENPNDPAIPNTKEMLTIADMKLGIYYTSEKFFLAASVTNLNNPDLSNNNENQSLDYDRHYYLVGGFDAYLNYDWTLIPAFQFKTDDNMWTQMDLSLLANFRERVTFGLSSKLDFRNSSANNVMESLSALIDFDVAQSVRIGYAFDLTTSRLGSYSGGSHEIMMAYRIVRADRAYVNARHFHN